MTFTLYWVWPASSNTIYAFISSPHFTIGLSSYLSRIVSSFLWSFRFESQKLTSFIICLLFCLIDLTDFLRYNIIFFADLITLSFTSHLFRVFICRFLLDCELSNNYFRDKTMGRYGGPPLSFRPFLTLTDYCYLRECIL